MRITQALRNPANWQDFETLCLMLWCEEWNSDDLKKNGRVGQGQDGVDISGHKDGEDEYSAIQCKCKSDGEFLKKEEIAEEIEKAKSFKPALKRYVIATTAKKDAEIEEFVRLKDLENRKAGLFSVDLKSWEDIVDMLERHKRVLNTYLDLITEDYSVSVSFGNGDSVIEITPVFSLVHYVAPKPEEVSDEENTPSQGVVQGPFGSLAEGLKQLADLQDRMQVINKPWQVAKTIETNRSYVPLKIVLNNDGTSPIDNFKLKLEFDCPGVRFTFDNVEEKGGFAINRPLMASFNSNVDFEGQTLVIKGETLNPHDNAVSDDFYIKVPYNVSNIRIQWQLLSRYYNDSGHLTMTVKPSFVEKECEDIRYAGRTFVEDFIEVKDVE